MRESSDYHDGKRLRSVEMPPVSYGLCRVYVCGVVGDLAAGLCQKHWDRGFGDGDKRRYHREG